MKVEFLRKFSKDLDRIPFKSTKLALLKVITEIEGAESLDGFPNLKKLSGHKSAYRIRLGDYRIGIFIERGTVVFARFVHRRDIYKLFP